MSKILVGQGAGCTCNLSLNIPGGLCTTNLPREITPPVLTKNFSNAEPSMGTQAAMIRAWEGIPIVEPSS